MYNWLRVEGFLSNLALYRKYRSADFNEVVGQNHVVKTLSNAIKNGRHSHAYLLTGPRGVGKTTIARIIAKRVNGLQKVDEITNYLDIIEIDGASNRGIDEIRSLREKIQVAPAKLNYKVYIIDEVHMLTKEAFNALLKTLEEPPNHVVFILATTEVHKLPDTIISRTQRFDFRPIGQSNMVNHLKFLADKEGIKITDEALELIARLSKGGFRDAISLLDQVSSLDDKIDVNTVAEFTGLMDTKAIENLFKLAKQNSINKLCLAIKELMDQGADANILLQQMLDYIQLNLITDSNFDHRFLIKMAENLHWAQTNIKYSSSPELVLQVALSRNLDATQTLSDPDLEIQKRAAPSINSMSDSAVKSASSKSNKRDSSNQSEALIIKALSIIKNNNNSLYAVLRSSDISIDGDKIIVMSRFSFHKDRILEQKNRGLIEKAFEKVCGNSMRLNADIKNRPEIEKVNPEEELVSTAAAIFGGEVTDA